MKEGGGIGGSVDDRAELHPSHDIPFSHSTIEFTAPKASRLWNPLHVHSFFKLPHMETPLLNIIQNIQY